MSNNPFEEMARVSAADTHPMERRVEQERRIQGSARAIRRACRIGMALFFGLAIGTRLLGNNAENSWITIVFYVFLVLAGGCLVLLFFMGGYVGGKGRVFLSDHLKDLADD